MSLQDVHQDRQKIMDEIVKSISNALGNISQQEPQLVANLVCRLSNDFNSKISPIFQRHGVTASAGGIFVHQQPRVKFYNGLKKETTREIGDLLLLMTRKNSAGIKRNALLLQAKKFHTVSEYYNKPYPQDQHYLYAEWPIFEYIQTKLKGMKRQVTPPCHDGAKYLLIGSHSGYCAICGASNYPWGAYTAYATSPKLSRHRCLVDELYDFFFGNVGRKFIYKHNINIDWDQVMVDLIDVTAKQVSTYIKNAGDPIGARGQGDLFFTYAPGMLMDQLKDLSNYENNDNPPVISEIENDEEGQGISIVEFIFEEI